MRHLFKDEDLHTIREISCWVGASLRIISLISRRGFIDFVFVSVVTSNPNYWLHSIVVPTSIILTTGFYCALGYFGSVVAEVVNGLSHFINPDPSQQS